MIRKKMDHLLSQLENSTPAFLLFGLGSMVFASLCALTGEAPLRGAGWAYRDQDPKRFWRRVTGYFLAGLILFSFGIYLYLKLDSTPS